MKAKEMATAFQNLAYEVGTSSDEMVQEWADYVDRITESYPVTREDLVNQRQLV